LASTPQTLADNRIPQHVNPDFDPTLIAEVEPKLSLGAR